MTSQGGLVVINRASHLCDPVSTLARVVGGLSFSRSQSDSEGFSPGTPVFLPPQNRLGERRGKLFDFGQNGREIIP